MLKSEKPEYEIPVEGVAWTRGAGHPAGVFLLDGRCYFVARGSPAEEVLADRGALHVANVKFDAEPLERSHTGREVRSLSAGEAARLLAGEGSLIR